MAAAVARPGPAYHVLFVQRIPLWVLIGSWPCRPSRSVRHSHGKRGNGTAPLTVPRAMAVSTVRMAGGAAPRRATS